MTDDIVEANRMISVLSGDVRTLRVAVFVAGSLLACQAVFIIILMKILACPHQVVQFDF